MKKSILTNESDLILLNILREFILIVMYAINKYIVCFFVIQYNEL